MYLVRQEIPLYEQGIMPLYDKNEGDMVAQEELYD
jgi:hypothetical protein